MSDEANRDKTSKEQALPSPPAPEPQRKVSVPPPLPPRVPGPPSVKPPGGVVTPVRVPLPPGLPEKPSPLAPRVPTLLGTVPPPQRKAPLAASLPPIPLTGATVPSLPVFEELVTYDEVPLADFTPVESPAPSLAPPVDPSKDEAVLELAPREGAHPSWVALCRHTTLEARALAPSQPARAALLLSLLARVSLAQLGDGAASERLLAEAASLEPSSRVVLSARRWLAERSGSPPAVLEALRAELAATETVRDRASLLWQGAALEWFTQGNTARAREALATLTGLQPQDVGARLALGWLDWSEQRPGVAVDSWLAAAGLLEEPAWRASLLAGVCAVQDASLSRHEAAAQTAERALEADPSCGLALTLLEGLALRRKDRARYASVLVAQADRFDDPAARFVCYERAGDVAWEWLRDGALAAKCYRQALAAVPEEPGPALKLESVLGALGQHEEQAQVLEQLVARATEPSQRAAWLFRLGLLFETRLGRTDKARSSFRRALAADAGFEPAREGLARLYRASERWEELLELELAALDREGDRGARATELCAVAARAEPLDPDARRARALYERAYELDPHAPGAFFALERLAREARDWPALARLYERATAACQDPVRKRALQQEHGHLLYEHLDDAEASARLLLASGCDKPEPLGPLLRLARALHDSAQWPRLVEALEAQLRLLTDGAELEAQLLQIASVQESRLRDLPTALTTLTRLLARNPRHSAARQARVRVLSSLGRWTDVVHTEREALEQGADPRRAAAVLFRIGTLLELRLGRPEDALACFRQALERSPDFVPARDALEAALRQRGEPARLAELRESDAKLSADPTQKARALCDAARLRELASGDLAAARSLYAAAFAARPDYAPAAWGLARSCEALEEWASARSAGDAVLGQLGGPLARRHWMLRLALLEELRLGDPRAATALLERARDAGEPLPNLAFEHARAALRVAGPGGLTAWLEAAAGAAKGTAFGLALHRLLALGAEYGKADLALLASRAYQVALDQAPEDVQVLDGLARCLTRLGRPEGVTPVLWGRAQCTEDRTLRLTYLLEAACLSASLGRVPEAEAALNRAANMDESLFVTRAVARAVSALSGDLKAEAEACARAGELSAHPAVQAELLLEAAARNEGELGRPEEALANLRSLLERQPMHAGALARALALLEKRSDWAQCARLLSAAVQVTAEPRALRALLSRRGLLLAEKLEDHAAALGDLSRARELGQVDAPLLSALALCYVRAQRWREAIDAYAALERVAAEPSEKRRSVLARATLWLDKVQDPAPARDLFSGLVARDPEDRDAARGLLRTCNAQGDTQRAREMLRSLVQSGPEQERFVDALALVELECTGASTASERADALGELAGLVARDASRLPAAESLLERLEVWEAFAIAAEVQLARVAPRGAGVLALRSTLARVYEQTLKRPDAAERHLRLLLEVQPEALEPRLTVARLRAGRDDTAALAELRRVVELEPFEARAWRGLFALAQRQGLSGPSLLAASALSLFGAGDAASESVLAAPIPPKPLPGALPPSESLTRVVGYKGAEPFSRKVLERLAPFLTQLLPAGQNLLNAAPLLPEPSPPAQWARAVAESLGVNPLALGRAPASVPLFLLSDPIALLLPPEMLHEGGVLSLLGWASFTLSCVAVGAPALQSLGAEQCVALVECALNGPQDAPGYRDLKKRLGSVLPRKVRKDLERLQQEEGAGVDVPREVGAWSERVRACGARVCVVYSRDLRVVLQGFAPTLSAATGPESVRAAIEASPMAVEALRFAATDGCWSLGRAVFGVP